MKLATTTADMREFTSSMAENIRFFAGTGFRYLDVNFYRVIHNNSPFMGDEWERWVAEAGEAAAELGITLCQAHSPDGKATGTAEEFDILMKATIRSIEACGRLGIPNIVVHQHDIGGYPSAAQRRQNLEFNRDFFAKLFPVMERTGVHVLVENGLDNHAPTPQNRRYYPATAAELLELADFIDHPLIQCCWDTGHANIQRVDQYQSLLELGPRLRAVHIADNNGDVDAHVAPFQGSTNFAAVVRGLCDIGFKGWFTFEASNMLRTGGEWPHPRSKWLHNGIEDATLLNVPLHVKKQAAVLLYEIGKHFLTSFDCFEE